VSQQKDYRKFHRAMISILPIKFPVLATEFPVSRK
jgi:hypothetical protein